MTSPPDKTGRGVDVVVKLGGSLLETGSLRPLLDQLCGSGARLALVPGGGPFADVVRKTQPLLGLTDRAAHHMAILGMQQMAIALMDMQPKLAAAEVEADFAAILDAGRVPVWLPDRLTRHDCAIPSDWTITSDGLAGRLAERLGARRVVLLKSRNARSSASLSELARDGLVDPTFGSIVGRAGLDWAVIGPGQWDRLPGLVSGSPGQGPPRSG